jgi:hypothetical protein
MLQTNLDQTVQGHVQALKCACPRVQYTAIRTTKSQCTYTRTCPYACVIDLTYRHKAKGTLLYAYAKYVCAYIV